MIDNGTEGTDYLNGTAQADSLYGAGGNDVLIGYGGRDLLDGGDGDDSLSGYSGSDTVLGGNGNDLVAGAADFGNDLCDGGSGNDSFMSHEGSDTLSGGAGDDFFLVEYWTAGDAVVASGGPGRDEYRVTGSIAGYTVTDFAPGAAGDVITLGPLLDLISRQEFYTGGNPFAAPKVLRLVQTAAGTELQFDLDGSASDFWKWETVIVLEGVAPGELTAENFDGIDPGGAPVAGVTLDGTGGADSLEGGLFDDQLAGLGGDDTLEGGGGADRLSGGNGNDVLSGGPGKDTLLGSAGDDVFIVPAYQTAGVATGGAGSDLYLVEAYSTYGTKRGIAVSDFAGGAGGDRIDVDALLLLSGDPQFDVRYAGGNPFAQDYLRLVDNGSHTLLQWDWDGPTGTIASWLTVLELRNVEPGALTADNFMHGIDPSGDSAAGALLSGADAADSLEGGVYDDTLQGAGGEDTLDGGPGHDTVMGGNDNDWMVGGMGNDSLACGDGDDIVMAFGVGVNWPPTMMGDDTYVGGNGNDVFDDDYGSNLFVGGEGNDEIRLKQSDGGTSTIIGGAGQDLFHPKVDANPENEALRIMDFQAGAGGDFIDPETLLGMSIGLEGDPFKGGFLKFVRDGADTLVRWDRDGAAGAAYTFKTQFRLVGVLPSEITSENFVGNLVVGTEDDDFLEGGLGDDTLQGLGGADRLDGSLGADLLEGGNGNDLYLVNDGGDQVVETANGPEPRPGGPQAVGLAGFIDTVKSVIDYSLQGVANVENLTLAGSARIGTGNGLDNRILGNARDNVLDGLGGSDTLKGGGGDDVLVWRGDDVTVQGNAGVDTLKVKVDGLDVDLTTVNGLSGVEKVDLRGAGDNALSIGDAGDIVALSDNDVLRILGDAGDSVSANGTWTYAGRSGEFHKFTSGAVTVYIETDVSQSLAAIP